MAACGSLHHIFDNPMPEKPTLFDSLSSSWKQQIRDSSSFTEIFGELHFKENHQPKSSSSSSISQPEIIRTQSNEGNRKSPTTANYYRHSDSFSSMNSDSLSLCTEGLGFESSDDVEDLGLKNSDRRQQNEEKEVSMNSKHVGGEFKKLRRSGGTFPPPISCIGRSGKPWVCFKSYRHDGRFILKEVRIPTQEFLQACREDGCLKLKFIQSDDEIVEEEEEEEEEEDCDAGENEETSDENVETSHDKDEEDS